MKYFKKITLSFLTFLIFFVLSCDDRVPTSTSSAVESGSLSLSHVYITGLTSNPTIVGELLSDAPAEKKVSIVVIARLLDSDGNGVNDKSLSFSIDDEIEGEWDTQDPSTKYVPNFKEFGFPDLGGNGYAYARFTPSNGVNIIETATSSGAIITVKYTNDIIDNVEFSIFGNKDLIWPFLILANISPIGSLNVINFSYQLDFVIPGILPEDAISLKAILEIFSFLYTP